MNYKEAMEYMEELDHYGIVPGLSNMRALLKRLGDPQDQLRFIHVAGTNGKGSTTTYLATILKEASYRVGTYTSPAVFEYRERFQVMDRMISQALFCKYLEEIRRVCDEMTQAGLPHPTRFEAETALAFLFFLEKKCDIVLLECGMGGLLDATNVVTTTVLSVITSISMDHTAFLGKTLAEIATNKAGIMKAGVPCVSAEQPQEVLLALRSKALEKKIRLYEVFGTKIKNVKIVSGGQRFDYAAEKNLKISLLGTYQIQNASLAVEAVAVLRKLGYQITPEALRAGLANAVWPGRMQKIASKPDFYLDGAHNPAAAECLRDTALALFSEQIAAKKLICIVGVFRDKEYEKLLRIMAPCLSTVITVQTPGNPRALSAFELAKCAEEVMIEAGVNPPMVTAADSLQEAVEMAYLMAGPDTTILAFGSLSYLGELGSIVQNRKAMRRDSHGQ